VERVSEERLETLYSDFTVYWPQSLEWWNTRRLTR